MPFINIKVTSGEVTVEQKEELIKGATDLLVKVLKKDPKRTFVIIEEVSSDNWGLGGETVTEYRKKLTKK